MEVIIENIAVYGGVALLCLGIVLYYLRRNKKKSQEVLRKVAIAKEEGVHEPVSLHPYIDLDTCIGSAACVEACPEKDILGIVDGLAQVIRASNCVGHGACFHACPVEAISLRIGTETRGVDLPHVNQNYETNMPGIYIAGELGGMGLIKNSVEQGKQAIQAIAKSGKAKREEALDVVIIGAGPAGIGATLMAKKIGLKSVTLDQDSLGGTVYNFPRAKIVMTSPVELPLYGKVRLYEARKEELLDLWRKVIAKENLDIREHVKVEQIVPQEDGTFRVDTSKGGPFIANHVLLAIGRRGSPRKLGIPGEGLEKVAYRLLDAEAIEGKKVFVVGGGDSAIEAALMLKDQNEVILSYRKGVFSRIKLKNRDKINKAIEDRSVHVLFHSNLKEILPDRVKVAIDGIEGLQEFDNDLVYIFAGGELPTQFLKKAGVEITKRFGYIVKKHG